MSDWLSDQWHTLVAVLGGGGAGAVLVKLVDQFRRASAQKDGHQRETRKQTDNVALDMVQHYEARLKAVEDQHRECQSEIAKLHEYYSDMKADLASLLTAIEISPEKAAEAVAVIKDKSRLKVSNARQAAQIETSARNTGERLNAPLASAKAVQPAIVPKD